jgi:hypothetical protein
VGVNIFILDRRRAKLAVAGIVHDIGSLRRFWKITELDGERSDELSAAEAAVAAMPSPKAAMLADVDELPLGSESGLQVRAHLVIGWDEGRTSVTDMGWDYLPILGFAVRDPDSKVFVLHEERNRALHRLDRERAIELGLIGPDGKLAKRGQPTISECRSVRPFMAGYAEAECSFDDGRQKKLLISLTDGTLPDLSWLAGKKPMQVEHYPPTPPASVKNPARQTGRASRSGPSGLA